MTYRDFTIEPSYYTETYDYWQDEKPVRTARTIEEAKQEIDDYYFERMHYRVYNQTSITKFFFLCDAVGFIKKFGGVIQPYLNGEKLEFDSI
jgi:hypothetical protein